MAEAMMSGAPQLESFAAGVETAVDVARVERQLTELWQTASASESGAITRASLFNLVAYTESATSRDRTSQIISELTSRHPCRAIVLLADASESRDELSASITAHCHLAGGGGKQVCCEQISLTATGRGVAQLPGAVLPLLESDLPTVLWWQGSFLERPDLFRRLAGVADQCVFDTSLWADVPFSELSAVIAAHPRCRFADLSWTRLAFWRGLTAELFDSPACKAELATLDAVSIVHGDGPGAQLRARLYGGWLAAQLAWSPVDTARRVRLSGSHNPEIGLVKITLKSTAGEFVICKELGQQTASTCTRLPAMCELPRRRALWPTDEVSLLSQELDCPTRHAVYERTLTKAVTVGRR